MNAGWLDLGALRQHSVDLRQFIDFRQAALANGTRIIEAHNSSGLTFTLLPDRGLDVWSAQYKGMPLTWISQGAPHPPDMGQSWLRQFNGGLIVTCGLTHVGPPEADAPSGAARGIHGLYTYQRAQDIAIHSGEEDAVPIMECSGQIAQASLFGEQLRVQRTIRLRLGDPGFTLHDTIENLGDTPTPLMLLYHCNLGYPLVRAGAKLLASSAVHPRDAAAWAGAATWETYAAATTGYAEQVFFHHVRADAAGHTQAALVNDEVALVFTWDTHELPYLTQWKNTRHGIYVCGIEPGNCIPEGQNAAREAGRLQFLVPGEKRRFTLRLHVIEKAEFAGLHAALHALSSEGKPAARCDLTPYQPVG